MADGSMKNAYMMLMSIIPLIKYVLFVNTFLFLSSLVPGAQFLRKLHIRMAWNQAGNGKSDPLNSVVFIK